jgi:hypothetical protein
VQGADLGVLGGEGVGQPRGAVARAVLDDDDLERHGHGAQLAGDLLDGGAEHRFFVVRSEHDGEVGCHGVSGHGCRR